MEETYHELNLEYTEVSDKLEGYSTPIMGPLDHEYGSYIDSSNSAGELYLSDEYFGVAASDGGQQSESKSQSSNRATASSGNLYGAMFDEQMEKEIDYLPIKDWQGEFQALLRMPDSYSKWRGIARLGLDFQHAASLYARVIVSECKLPENQKTIHSADVGGVAGGIKVICQGILFKVAIDKIGMYGNDANAAKAAGHEFKSTTAFFDLGLPDVQLPLMALIDYRGFRVTAMSLLPISGQDTLIYGSSDGGRTVQDSDPHFNQLMERAGKLLNLRSHLCGRDEPKSLFMPVDVEGHVTLKFRTKGKSENSNETTKRSPSGTNLNSTQTAPLSTANAMEGNEMGLQGSEESYKRSYVILDLARLFPPQKPLEPPEKGSKQRSYLYELLRPEFVKTNPVPLSSDAFSPFNLADPNAKRINEDVTAACNRLVAVRIPQFAMHLEKGTLSGLTPVSDLNCARFVMLMHRQGINLRFLGLVRRSLVLPKTRNIALMEMVSRVIKDQINQTFRNMTETIQLPVEEPYREAVVEYLNKLFGFGADEFWRTEIMPAILKKFKIKFLVLDAQKDLVLGPEELPQEAPEPTKSKLKKSRPESSASEPNLRHYINPLLLWERVSELTGVTLRSDSLRVMTGGFGISSSDIKTLNSRIRVTDVMNRALAVSVSMDARSKRGTEAFRLYKRAHTLFADCLEVSASNAATFYYWGQMLHEMAQHDLFAKSQNSLKLLKLGALPKLAQAVQLQPAYYDAHAELAWTLLDFLLHHSRFEAVNAKTSTTNALKDTTAILDRAGHHLVNSLGPIPERISKSLLPHPSMFASTSTLSTLGLTQSDPSITNASRRHPLHVSSDGAPPRSSSAAVTSWTSTSGGQAAAKSLHNSSGGSSPKNAQNAPAPLAHSDSSPSVSSPSPLQTKKKLKTSKKEKESPREVEEKASSAVGSLQAHQKSISAPITKVETTATVLPAADPAWLPDEFQIRFDAIERRIIEARPSLFMALSFALWDHPVLHGAIFNRGAQLEDLDLSDASFMPKYAFTTIAQVCPNLTALTLRNPSFLDSITAGDMLSPANIMDTVSASHSTSSPSVLPQKSKNSRIKRALQELRSDQSSKETINTVKILSNFTRLKSLQLCVCDHLTDIEDFDLLYWPHLELLKFEKCNLSDGFFGTRINARQLPALTSLVISGSMISDASLNKLCTQFGSQLRVLDLSICLNMQFVSCFNHNVTNPNFTGLKALTHLDLSGCRSISQASISNFVKTLSLSSSQHVKYPSISTVIAASTLRHSANSTVSLTFLNLDGCTSIGEDIWHSLIKRCPNLTSLSMEKSSATSNTLLSVSQHCPHLTRLHAPACKNLEPLSLLKVLQACPQLTYLDASFWLWNKDELASKIAKNWTTAAFPTPLKLEQLYCCAWSLETPLMQLFFMHAPQLTTLDLSNCMSLSPEIFNTIALSCLKLEKITANGFMLTDESVEALTAGCKHLSSIAFQKAHDLTDNSLIAISRCSTLTKLNLTHSPFITNNGVQIVLSACSNLVSIGLKGCKLITAEFMFEKLRHSCTRLRIDIDAAKTVPWSFPLP